MMWIDCDEIRDAWIKEYPDKDYDIEGFREEVKIRLSEQTARDAQ